MNNPYEDKPTDEFLLTFTDLVQIIKKNKNKIYKSAIFFAVLAVCYGLTKPVEYEAEGTFKEKGKSQSGLGNSLSATFFMISDGFESNAATIMRSRKLMEDLIKEQGLQGVIVKDSYTFPFIPFNTIKNNLLIEYATFKNLQAPILNDPKIDFYLKEITYHQEVPMGLQMKVLSEDKFAIYNAESKQFEEGFFNHPYSKNGYSFIIKQNHSTPIVKGEYTILLLPLKQTAQSLTKRFIIELDRNDKSLLKITYKHSNRQQAADNINTLMALYQKHIQCEHENVCETQVNYLSKKQKEIGKLLENMLQEHANNLSSDLSSTGFASSEKAMDFLANTQHQLKQKLFVTNLEIQRLQKEKNQEFIDNDIFSSLNNFDVVNKLSTEKRHLKQQADALNLVLRNIPTSSREFKESFITQLQDLENLKHSLKDSQLAMASLNKNEVPEAYPRLTDNSQYIYKDWHERLAKAKNNLDNAPSDNECLADWELCKNGFSSYLSQLNHYLNVYQKNIEERLVNQQAPLKEFQGINLNIAKELYVAYNRDLSSLESTGMQYEFIVNQLNDPDFEISPLSTILTDPLSLELISKTSNLILALKDQDNRSSKEQERLTADLAILKGSLKTHVQQSISLLALRQQFLKEKILHLQSINFSLIQEQISILDNQIKEYISSTLENLKQEKKLIESNLAELRFEMSSFPQKWAAEQQINQQMDINKSLVEEISKLVESKNISNNLEKLQSAPVDAAFPPIHPKSPRLILLAIIGAIAGSFLSFIWILGWSVINGVQTSSANLIASGQYVCGPFSRKYQNTLDKDPLLDKDLNTLRRLIAFMESSKDQKNTLLLLEGKGPDYSPSLAELLAFKGKKILIIDLYFGPSQDANSSGILQYLEEKTTQPAISKFASYDKIETGGISRYANELIGSQRFKDLLSSLTKQYDWILISSSASPMSAEAENLMDIFPLTAVSITDESIQDIKKCIHYADDKKSKIAFILATP